MNDIPIDSMFRNELVLKAFDNYQYSNINLMLFNEIDNFIEVYSNSVIELVQCFGTSFCGWIDHLASSVIKFRPKNSVPKHCIRSITYNYLIMFFQSLCHNLTESARSQTKMWRAAFA